MKKIAVILMCIFILCGCQSKKELSEDNIRQLETIISENNYIIVDVRSEEEYEVSHVKDAINIEYTLIDDSIELDKEKDILVYCASGRRSNIAATKLSSMGYKVYDLGGLKSINQFEIIEAKES